MPSVKVNTGTTQVGQPALFHRLFTYTGILFPGPLMVSSVVSKLLYHDKYDSFVSIILCNRIWLIIKESINVLTTSLMGTFTFNEVIPQLYLLMQVFDNENSLLPVFPQLLPPHKLSSGHKFPAIASGDLLIGVDWGKARNMSVRWLNICLQEPLTTTKPQLAAAEQQLAITKMQLARIKQPLSVTKQQLPTIE